ncbi:MAG TPA: CheR family methyltransferase, partial [Byssovorax sp.]
MDELLARHTTLPILHVEDAMEVRANPVYLIPKKKEMIISGGRLLLSERDRQQELTLPIDVFFRSLAQDCGRRAIAIVLSGGGSDGSRGIRAVHDAGGLVLVQSAESAQFDGMPRAAREAGVAAHLLAPDEMPKVVVDYAQAGGALPEPTTVGATAGLGAVYAMLQEEFGIDFTHYKPSTVTRRIERRLQLSRADDMHGYVARLRSNRHELDVLYRDLLIGVTRFFRNHEAFEVLEQRVLPELLQAAPRGEPFRAWVAGCATGEEVYSLAIVLHELAARFGDRPIKIFASDVHRGSIEAAAAGVYAEQAVAGVSPERLARYFTRRGSQYQVVPELRQLVVFAAHDVIRDAPFTRMNLVTCRNMLIYLRPAAQQKVLTLFHFALARGGVLFLGPSEHPGALLGDFETIDRHWRIYRKFSDTRMTVDTRLQPARSLEARLASASAQAVTARPSLVQLLGTYDALLDRFMPPSLLLNERGELVHAFGGASRFLERRDGRQGLDVLDAVDGELKMVLAAGKQRALKEQGAVVFRGVRAGDDPVPYKVTVEAYRGRTGAPGVLVSFESTEQALARDPSVPDREVDLRAASREQLDVLEAELSHTKENLQTAIEELETSNEELQAANEELLASNEELQSTNEELQSVNEELYTVNAEYQRKIGELTELTNDIDNLFAATEVGTIFLDHDLRIRKFTPEMGASFNLLAHDVGRPIDVFAHDLDYPEFVADLRRVLATGDRVEREVRDPRGVASFLRMLPYRARGGVAGVIVTLIDVSGLKAAEDALFHERYLLNSLLASMPDAIYFKDARGRFIRANAACASRLGFSGDLGDLAGKSVLDMPNQAAALALHRQDEDVLAAGAPRHYELERRADGQGWDLATRLPLTDVGSGVVGVIGVLRDITHQVEADEKIQESVKRRDQFLAMLSHELRNPLAAIVTAGSLLASHSDRAPNAKIVSVINRQSHQMARLLDDLLDVSRVTQNKIALQRAPLDFGVLVRESADAMRDAFAARGVDLALDVPDKPLLVYGD